MGAPGIEYLHTLTLASPSLFPSFPFRPHPPTPHAQLSLAVEADMYLIPSHLPSSDEVQRRLIPLLARYMEWHEHAEGIERAHREEQKAMAVQDFLERKRLLRIAAHRLKRDAPG